MSRPPPPDSINPSLPRPPPPLNLPHSTPHQPQVLPHRPQQAVLYQQSRPYLAPIQPQPARTSSLLPPLASLNPKLPRPPPQLPHNEPRRAFGVAPNSTEHQNASQLPLFSSFPSNPLPPPSLPSSFNPRLPRPPISSTNPPISCVTTSSAKVQLRQVEAAVERDASTSSSQSNGGTAKLSEKAKGKQKEIFSDGESFDRFDDDFGGGYSRDDGEEIEETFGWDEGSMEGEARARDHWREDSTGRWCEDEEGGECSPVASTSSNINNASADPPAVVGSSRQSPISFASGDETFEDRSSKEGAGRQGGKASQPAKKLGEKARNQHAHVTKAAQKAEEAISQAKQLMSTERKVMENVPWPIHYPLQPGSIGDNIAIASGELSLDDPERDYWCGAIIIRYSKDPPCVDVSIIMDTLTRAYLILYSRARELGVAPEDIVGMVYLQTASALISINVWLAGNHEVVPFEHQGFQFSNLRSQFDHLIFVSPTAVGVDIPGFLGEYTEKLTDRPPNQRDKLQIAASTVIEIIYQEKGQRTSKVVTFHAARMKSDFDLVFGGQAHRVLDEQQRFILEEIVAAGTARRILQLAASEGAKSSQKQQKTLTVGRVSQILGTLSNSSTDTLKATRKALGQAQAARAPSALNFCCSTCGKRCRTSQALREHEGVHAVDRNFCCDKCDANFTSQGRLASHKLIHEPTHRFACTLFGCPKRFKTAQSRNAHSKTHNEYTFVCDECGEAYARSDYLRNHKRSHEKEKKYPCTVAGCGKMYRDKYTRNKHVSNHNVEKKFVCKLGCGKKFLLRHDCTSHEATYHPKGSPPWSCGYSGPKCGKEYKRSGDLVKHLRTCHPEVKGVPPPTVRNKGVGRGNWGKNRNKDENAGSVVPSKRKLSNSKKKQQVTRDYTSDEDSSGDSSSDSSSDSSQSGSDFSSSPSQIRSSAGNSEPRRKLPKIKPTASEEEVGLGVGMNLS